MNKIEIERKQLELMNNKYNINSRTNHPVIIGDYCEYLVKQFLTRIIKKYKLGTGLIQKDLKNESAVNNQCDIIIYDGTIKNYFEAGDIVIVPPESVKAVVEVKATTPSGYIIQEDVFGQIKKMNHKIKCYYWVFNTNVLKKDLEELDNLDAAVRISSNRIDKPKVHPDELYNFLVQLKNDLKI